MGLALYEHIYLKGKVTSQVCHTQVMFWAELVVGGVENLLATKYCWQHSKWV